MGEVKNNNATKGISGKVGDLLFRQRDERTFVSKPPRKQRQTSEVQLAKQERFLEAVDYAKEVLEDPSLKAEYEAAAKAKTRKVSAYALAVGDFLAPPTIHHIKTDGYTGVVGDKIKIRATDIFKVTKVIVRIQKADGSPIEAGSATLSGAHWIYTATAANPSLSGTKIIVQAYDLPENTTQKEVIL